MLPEQSQITYEPVASMLRQADTLCRQQQGEHDRQSRRVTTIDESMLGRVASLVPGRKNIDEKVS